MQPKQQTQRHHLHTDGVTIYTAHQHKTQHQQFYHYFIYVFYILTYILTFT